MPKLYCAYFGDLERTNLDGKTHVKMKGAGLGGNEHTLGWTVFERLLRGQLKELLLSKFCMDRPNDFSVTAADGTFSLRADLSDKRKDLGTVWWHGCELLVTRPWLPRDYDEERGHPLCVPSFAGACAVCMDTLGPADRVTHVECCEHNFHEACLQEWFGRLRADGRAPTCPTCRRLRG